MTDRESSDTDDQLGQPQHPPDPPARDEHESTTPFGRGPVPPAQGGTPGPLPQGGPPPPPPQRPEPTPPYNTGPLSQSQGGAPAPRDPGRPQPQKPPPPPGYQGYPGGQSQQGEDRGQQPGGDRGPGQGGDRGPAAGAHRVEAPSDWSDRTRMMRTDHPEWTAVRDSGRESGPLSGQWGDAAPQQSRWAEPPQGGPANWSYVDSLRTSELVRTRKTPPARGWRRAVFKGSFGLINPGQSPDERRQAELEAKVRSLLRGHFKIGVLGKGGVGKTTIAASVGSIFAALRQDDRVVAIDADTAFGKLGSRVDPNAAGSYWELAADQHLYSFADVRSRVGNNAAGLFVLAGESSTARRRVLDPAIYREATARLDNHFTLSIVDCGSTLDAPITQEVLRDLDALIVVSSPWVDGASAAGQTMEWLANRGQTGLLHRTVVVLNDSDGHADKRTRSVLVQQFGSRGQVVIEVPFDPHLRPGGVIDVNNEINRTTRRRMLEIAASIAEHFAATTDGPRERR